MDLLPTEEQLEIATAAAMLLAKELPGSRRRELFAAEVPFDDRVWASCAELGWFGLGVAEGRGGVGYGLGEEALLFREIGRHLAGGPFLATALGARVATAAGPTDIGESIIGGAAPVALAVPRGGVEVGDRVTGSFDVLDAPGTQYVVVVDAAGAALVETAALGALERLPCIDPGARLGRVAADGVPAVAFVPADVEPLHLRGTVLTAAMLTGIAEATRDLSATHARDRIQFGKPIGVHQAIKHRCADMAVRADAALQQLLFAAVTVGDGRPDAGFQAAAAKVVATDAAVHNAAETIQVHGGMGFTFEHDSHLYVKRARLLDRCLGDVRHHMARLLASPPAQ